MLQSMGLQRVGHNLVTTQPPPPFDRLLAILRFKIKSSNQDIHLVDQP